MKPQWSDWSICTSSKKRSRLLEPSCSLSETCPADWQSEECYQPGDVDYFILYHSIGAPPHSLHSHSDFISDLTLTNSSFTELYNKVMTFNESNVTATCCKVDGSAVSVTCGQGFSCAASCFSLQASLCPSQNCGACHRPEEEEVRGRQNSGATEASGGLSHCTRNQCKVGGRFKECCFHPVCRKRRPKKCAWLQYLVGK